MNKKSKIEIKDASKVISYDYDEEEGVLSIYVNLKPVVEWVVEDGEDGVDRLLEDFREILDLGISIGVEAMRKI